MKTRSALTWMLVSVAMVFAYWYTGTLRVEHERKVFEAKRIFDFEGEQVIRLSITTQGNATVEAKRVGENEWVLDEPFAHVIPNHALWTQLANNVPYIINERSIEASTDDLSLYALDDPPLSIVIETSRNELIQLDVGNLDPTRNNHYARLASGELFLLPSQMAKALYRSLDDLRDKQVFHELDYTVDRVRYSRLPVDDPNDGLEPQPGIDEDYVLGADDQWRMVQPLDALVIQRKLTELIGQIQFLTGEDFIDAPGDLGDYGFDPPWARLSVGNSEKGTEQTLLFGWLDDMADDGRMFAKLEGNPTVFTVDAAFPMLLPGEPFDYRENHLFTAEARNLRSIEYKDSDDEFVLTDDEENGWTLTDPPYADTNSLAVSQLITTLKNIPGSRFPDEDEIAKHFGEERIRYTFNFNDGSPSRSISVGGAVPDSSDPVMIYVRQDFSSVTTVPFQFIRLLTINTFRFRDHDLLRFEPSDATALSIKLDGKSYVLKRREGIWMIVRPEGHIVEDLSDITTLLNGLRSMFAVDIADPAPSIDVTGIDTPMLEASVTFTTDDVESHIGPLRLGNLTAPSSRYRYATLAGRPETFFVDHGLIEDLRKGLQGIRPREP